LIGCSSQLAFSSFQFGGRDASFSPVERVCCCIVNVRAAEFDYIQTMTTACIQSARVMNKHSGRSKTSTSGHKSHQNNHQATAQATPSASSSSSGPVACNSASSPLLRPGVSATGLRRRRSVSGAVYLFAHSDPPGSTQKRPICSLKHPEINPFSTFCVAVHIFVTYLRDFKFGT